MCHGGMWHPNATRCGRRRRNPTGDLMSEPEGKLLAAALDRIDALYEMTDSLQKQVDTLATAVRELTTVASGLVEDANNTHKRLNVAFGFHRGRKPDTVVVDDIDPMSLLDEAEATDEEFPIQNGEEEK